MCTEKCGVAEYILIGDSSLELSAVGEKCFGFYTAVFFLF
jgi:hypothetical protein